MDYQIVGDNNDKLVYRRKSEWIPLNEGMKIGSGASLEIGKSGQADIQLDNQLVMRLKSNSRVNLEKTGEEKESLRANLHRGRILCRVDPKSGKSGKKSEDKLRVVTPAATARIVGTTFSISYDENLQIMHIDVLEGTVKMSSSAGEASEISITRGQAAEFAAFLRVPTLNTIPDQVRDALGELDDLQMEATTLAEWDRIVQLVFDSPLYRRALTEITRYELKVFSRSILYLSPLRWDYEVPARLQAVELEDGDYKDPWDTPYHYEKLGPKKAVLISAGPDKILHTSDDVFRSIIL
jgi:hypothetical protein